MDLETIIKKNKWINTCPYCNTDLTPTTFRTHLKAWECHLNNGTKRREHDANVKELKHQKKIEKQHFCKICNKQFEGLNFCKKTHEDTQQHQTNKTKLLKKIEEAKNLLNEWQDSI
jgi:hypothetical protein